MTIYIKIDGLAGNVTTKGYEGCFEATSCDHEVSRQVITEAGRTDNRQSSKPHITAFVFTKAIDKTTPLLHSQAAYSQRDASGNPQTPIAAGYDLEAAQPC